jgi:hypothetical protein
VTFAVTENTISGRRFRRFGVTVCQTHRRPLTEVDEIYGWLVTVEGRRLSVYFLYLAWRLWKSVVTFAMTSSTISGRVFRRCRMTVFQRHRLPFTGSRPDIRLLSYSGKTPTFCVFPVFIGAVMEKCSDVCGDEEYYFRSGFSTFQNDGVSAASIAVDRKLT